MAAPVKAVKKAPQRGRTWSSQYVGVTKNENRGAIARPWGAIIYSSNSPRQENLGFFATEMEAVRAYDARALELGKPVNLPNDLTDAFVDTDASADEPRVAEEARRGQYVGIIRDGPPATPWRARICIKSKRIPLGCFASEEEAARAFDARARPLGRPLNFPDEAADEKAEHSTDAEESEEVAAEQEVESEQVSDEPALPTLTDSRARGSKRARTSACRIYCDVPGCGKLIEGKVLVRKRDVELAVQRRQTSGEKWCGTCGPRGELMHEQKLDALPGASGAPERRRRRFHHERRAVIESRGGRPPAIPLVAGKSRRAARPSPGRRRRRRVRDQHAHGRRVRDQLGVRRRSGRAAREGSHLQRARARARAQARAADARRVASAAATVGRARMARRRGPSRRRAEEEEEALAQEQGAKAARGGPSEIHVS